MKIVFCFICPLYFSQVVFAQETLYSADALMAAFKKGSQESLKGAEITLTGVPTEIKETRVVFRSSGNDKVICELTSPVDRPNKERFVGKPVTVVGKVRGRGLLGNVTLDACKLSLSDAISKESIVPEPVHELSQVSAAQAEEPIEQASGSGNLPETAPIDRAEIATKRPPPAEPGMVTRPDAVTAPPRPLDPGASLAPTASAGSAAQSTGILPGTSRPSELTLRNIFALLVAGLAGMGIGALLTFLKLRRAEGTGSRFYQTQPTTEAVRRAALEKLLSGQKK